MKTVKKISVKKAQKEQLDVVVSNSYEDGSWNQNPLDASVYALQQLNSNNQCGNWSGEYHHDNLDSMNSDRRNFDKIYSLGSLGDFGATIAIATQELQRLFGDNFKNNEYALGSAGYIRTASGDFGLTYFGQENMD